MSVPTNRAAGDTITAADINSIATLLNTTETTAGAATARANHTGAQAISTVTGLQSALDGKLTATTLFPLGSAENPVTDAAAARPAGIPVVWWRTPTSPTNAAVGDWVFLPDGTSPTVTTLYEQHFLTDIAGFTARTNADTLTFDAATATGSAGGSLRWRAVATGVTIVRPGSNTFAVTPGSTPTFKVSFRNNGAAARTATALLDYYDNNINNVAPGTFVSASVSVPTGTGFTELTFTHTIPAGVTRMAVNPRIDGVAAETYHVDKILVTL